MGWLSSSSVLPYIFCLLFIHSQVNLCSSSMSSSSPSAAAAAAAGGLQYHPEECSALFQFRSSFPVSNNYSPCQVVYGDSWGKSMNCCSWDGITCDKVTGHVIGLDLYCSRLQGTISSNSSLFLLRHLQQLDLSKNDFRGSPILAEFGQFKNMTHLDLSSTNFSGHVPLEISHLSKLVFFRLSVLTGEESTIYFEEAAFKGLVQNLNNLRELYLLGLDMSSVPPVSLLNVSSSILSLSIRDCQLHGELPENLFHLKQLQELHLDGNKELTGSFPKSNWSNPLSILELSNTKFSIDLPHLFQNSRSLSQLYLSGCNIVGSLPPLLSNLTELLSLDLSHNNISGPIPWSFLALDQLRNIDLSYNNFIGQLPEALSNFTINFSSDNSSKYLSSLDGLHLSNNLLSGTIPSWLFSLPYLVVLDLGNNLFSGGIGEFPHFLRSPDALEKLDISCNQIRGDVPRLLWEVGKNSLYSLNISHNFLTNMESLPWKSLLILDLRSNLFSGSLPILSPQLLFFSGSKNQFAGKIPISICNLTSLQVLDFSYNHLSGKIPQCIGSFSQLLSVLDLRMNKLHGPIPPTYSKVNSLRNLNLNGNLMEGPLPRSLVHCKNLEVLDLGNNLLNDTFPHWLETLPELRVLVLRSNQFYGSIGNPKTQYPFPELRIMDLSYNEFSGILPKKYFANFRAMVNANKYELKYMGEDFYFYQDSVMVTLKGLNIELVKIQNIFTTIDFSRNHFFGEIPEVIGKLKSLKGLNFSHNMLLRGTIPSTLGNLTDLEWLDLSCNKLSGAIPAQLVDLTSLAFLNLSHNQLLGPIPHGNQFNTFNNDSFVGNLGLCGFPLSKMCNNEIDDQPSPPTFEEEVDDSEDTNGWTWKIIMMGFGSGFVIGISLGYTLLYSDEKFSWICERIVRKQQCKRARRPKKKNISSPRR